MKISVLVVDDEKLACEGVSMRLYSEPDIDVIGECANGCDAIEMIVREKPDLVFLDIKMPEISGFDVIDSVRDIYLPEIVFLTASSEHAIKAFRVDAVDYLLKPINDKNFDEALKRARKRIFDKRYLSDASKVESVLTEEKDNHLAERSVVDDCGKIIVRSKSHVWFLSPAEIEWVEAYGDYVRIHSNNKVHLFRETMKKMEQKLAPFGFERIHRSIIVKLAIISELIALKNGEYDVILTCNERLRLSRTYRDKLFEALAGVQQGK